MIDYAIKPKEDKTKPKIKYAVYDHELQDYADGWMGDYDGRIQEFKHFVGYIWAKSPEQAVAQMAYRLGRHVSEHCDWAYDGHRENHLEAEEA